jgi:hypothetical protein
VKKIAIKRLVYNHLGTGEVCYGGQEYDSNLTDENILGAIFTLGKHEWHPGMVGIYQLNTNGELKYRITVETFYRYQKSWYNLLADNIKRILRI